MHLTAEAALGLAWLLDAEGNDVLLSGGTTMTPWLHADFPTVGRQFAIWMVTGAVHIVQSDGAVEDDPRFVPPSYTKQKGTDRLMHLLETVTDERDQARRQLADARERERAREART